MIKTFIAATCLFFLAVSSVYADATTILTPLKNAVQCNKWGWMNDYPQTAWHSACAPLEVKSATGQIYSVTNTANKCHEDEVAVYLYKEGNTVINFTGCFARS